jgi:hypothetical protein
MDRYHVPSGAKFKLSRIDPDDTGKFSAEDGRETCEAETARARGRCW